MKNKKLISGLLSMAAVALFPAVGCNDTATGAQKDAGEISQATKEGAGQAGETMKETAKDLGAAGTLTPMIKSAIVANPTLNDKGNDINVDSSDEAVTLNGTVASDEAKQLAESIAKKVMDEKKSHQKLVNELEVKK